MYCLKLCYICLQSGNKELIDVNQLDIDNISYLTKLKSCICCNFQQNDSMEICWQCIKQLRAAHQFKTLVLESQETIRKLTITQQSNSAIGDPILSEFLVSKQDVETKCKSDKLPVADETNPKVYDDSDSSDCFLADLKVKMEASSNDSEPLPSQKEISNSNCDNNSERKKPKITKPNIRERPRTYTKRLHTQSDYECPQCNLRFDKRWKLHKHNTNVHSQERKFVCTYCDRGFKQSFHLREHLTSHTGERNYSCSFCDKTFQRISSQKRHMKSHEAAPGQKTKRTPFLCTICGKSFPFSNGVQRHMRIHTGVRNHECKMCNRRFAQSTHLHVHMRTHTGEKPYICDLCGEAFSLNASLQKHMQLHRSVNVKVETFM